MRIEEIRIKNFKIFKNVTVKNIPQMLVLIGANGLGKSTFFDVFGFLNDALQNNVTIALQKRGGFPDVISRGCDIGGDLIEFEIKFKNSSKIDQKKDPLKTYSLKIGFDPKTGKSLVRREIFKFTRGDGGQPWKCLDFTNGKGLALTESEFSKGKEAKREGQEVSSPDILAIKGLGQFARFEALSSFRALLEKWHVSDFKIDLARTRSEAGVAIHLSKTADNLAQVAQNMFDYHREIFDQILEKLPKQISGLSKVQPKRSEDGMIYLHFTNKFSDRPFTAKNVSDGTIKLYAIAA